VEQGVRQLTGQLTEAFDQGKAEPIVALFLETGELIDEQGTVHAGHVQIKELLDGFFAKFPGSTMSIESEAIRQVGPVVIDDGSRIITDATGVSSVLRYTAVMVQTEQGWRIASIRDFPEETVPTAGELLQPLAWLVGEWVNEGADGRVQITYRWSEDENYIMGEFTMMRDGQPVGKSTQRIGWDALLGQPRSWVFDSDGGFSQAIWTETESGWVVKSTATLPDGRTGSATLRLQPESDSRFRLSGVDRIVGSQVEDDYELMVVRRPQTTSN
jgi:uncharacterized protein (TIGR02246 family)